MTTCACAAIAAFSPSTAPFILSIAAGFAATFACGTAAADLALDPLFRDHAVLQRDRAGAVSGCGTAVAARALTRHRRCACRSAMNPGR